MSTDTTDDVRALREALKIAETTAHPELGAVTLAHVADAARIARVLDEMDRLRARVDELERDAARPTPDSEAVAAAERQQCLWVLEGAAKACRERSETLVAGVLETAAEAVRTMPPAAAIRARGAATQQCRCTFAQHMQGDGCEVCNPGAATGVQP